MKLRAVIVDDEPLARDLLRAILEELPDIEIVESCADAISALIAIHDHLPDVVFLDVEMPGETGVGIAKSLRHEMSLKRDPEIVFVTAFQHYAIEAIRVSASDYILKPVEEAAVVACLERVRARIRSRGVGKPKQITSPPIIFKDGERRVIVEPDDIIWVQAERDYVRLHLRQKTEIIRSTLKAVEAQLPDNVFQRVHRSAIVNLGHVRELRPAGKGAATALMSDGIEVTVSRSYGVKLKQRL